MVLDHPVDASDDIEHAASTGAPKHPNRHDSRSLGDTIDLPSHGASHVRAVAVAVFAASPVTHPRSSCYDAPTKVAVVASHTSVDDVCVDACTGVVVGVILVESSRALINSIQTPRRWVGLIARDSHHRVFFDVLHVRVVGQQSELCLV